MLNFKTFFKILVYSSFLLNCIIVTAQTIITSQNFEALPAGLGYSVSNSNYVNVDNTYGEASTASLKFSNNDESNNRSSTATFDDIDISYYSNVTVTISFASYRVDNNENLLIDFSYDGGVFTDQQKLIDGQNGGGGETWDWGTPDNDGGAVNSNPYTFTIPSRYNTLAIRVRARNLDDSEYLYIDNLIIQGDLSHCESYGNNADGYTTGIRLVDFNTISNSTPIEDNDYSDFTSISTTLSKSNAYNLSVNLNTDGDYTVYAVAWIDWNQDAVFNDTNERYELGYTDDNSNGITSLSPLAITVPSTAAFGSTRMRVSAKWIDYPTSCETGFDGEVEDYTIIVSCGTNNSWTGAVSDDWNNDANWDCGEVPSLSNIIDVLIPTGLTTYPIIYSTGTDGYVNNIELEGGSKLTIFDNSIEITGTLILNGMLDLEGESQLIQTTGSTIDISSTGYLERDQQGEFNRFRYNYWSSPVLKQGAGNASSIVDGDPTAGTFYSISDVLRDGTDPSNPIVLDFTSGYDGFLGTPITLSTYWMYKYANHPEGTYSAWEHLGSTGAIYAGEGFIMKGAGDPDIPETAEQNYVFEGKPNNGTITLTVASGNEYLIGNPYPSALDANEFLITNSPSGRNSIRGEIYFWEHNGGNSHNLRDYIGGYATYNFSGGVPAAAQIDVSQTALTSPKVPGQYIAVGQSFYVVGEPGGIIEFNNGQRTFEKEATGASVFMKSNTKKNKNTSSEKADSRLKVRFGFEASNTSHRQILLTIDENASDEVDWGYDSERYTSIEDDMFWILNNSKYVIQATNEITDKKEFPIGIQTQNGGEVSIKIDELLNIPEGMKLFLKDNLTGTLHNILGTSFEINLEPGEYLERFSIVFESQKPVIDEVNLVDEIIVFMDNSSSQLILKSSENNNINTVQVFNYMGQLISNWENVNSDTEINLPLEVDTGVYLVYLNTNNGNFIRKILIE